MGDEVLSPFFSFIFRYPGHFDAPKSFKLSKFTPFCTSVHVWEICCYYNDTSAAIWLFRNLWIIDMSELWIDHLHISLRVTHLISIEKSDVLPVLLYIPAKNISFIRKDTKNPFLPWSQQEWARCYGCLDTIDRLLVSKHIINQC